ncbi:MAG: hypothetical protein QOH63_4215 [Acidobacteriota bacterium]|jgi:hypothetical protein|nr:hypothetical protein [Acidobacteriota bacterium]
MEVLVFLARPISTFQTRPRETFLKKAGMRATEGFNIPAFLHESYASVNKHLRNSAINLAHSRPFYQIILRESPTTRKPARRIHLRELPARLLLLLNEARLEHSIPSPGYRLFKDGQPNPCKSL